MSEIRCGMCRRQLPPAGMVIVQWPISPSMQTAMDPPRDVVAPIRRIDDICAICGRVFQKAPE